jgi:hypothetical protein
MKWIVFVSSFFFLLLGCGEANVLDKPPRTILADPFLSSVAVYFHENLIRFEKCDNFFE